MKASRSLAGWRRRDGLRLHVAHGLLRHHAHESDERSRLRTRTDLCGSSIAIDSLRNSAETFQKSTRPFGAFVGHGQTPKAADLALCLSG